MAFLSENQLTRFAERFWVNILNKIQPDTTLGNSGQAADAKVVGDTFSELVGDVPVSTQISKAINNNVKQPDWNQTNDKAINFIKNRPEATTIEDIQSLFLE